jgi:hypothetical protein
MWYKDQFNSNLDNLLFGDYTEAKNLKQLESMISGIAFHLERLHDLNAPEVIIEPYNKRLMEVMAYYKRVGGNKQ